MEGKVPISLAIFFLGYVSFVSAFEEQHGGAHGKTLDAGDSDLDLDKRLYDLGASRKPHSHMSEYKRLPLYNFGLGKRIPRYNFGLGKRFVEEPEVLDDYDDYPFAEEDELVAVEPFFDEEAQVPEKRQQPYSFGLGKRLPKYDFGLGKRAGPYDFGLGKRTQRFNFGLGKRGSESANRYSFGLGKRMSESELDLEPFRSFAKREVSSKELEAFNGKNNIRGNQTETSHELDKRSRNSVLSANNLYRRYRKPSYYNFGLGKRIPLYDFGLGKRSYQPDNENMY